MNSFRLGWLLVVFLGFFILPNLAFSQSTSINDSVNRYRVFYKDGNYPDAISAAENALNLSRLEFGSSHSYTATILNDLAIFYKAAENYPKAKNLFAQALAIQVRNFGSGHPIVANTLIGLGQTYHFLNDYAASERHYQRALKINKSKRNGRPELVVNIGKLAQLYANTKRPKKAEILYLEAIEIAEQNLGSDHLLTANFLNILAAFYHDRKRYSAARPMYMRAISIREKRLGTTHELVRESSKNLSRLQEDMKRSR